MRFQGGCREEMCKRIERKGVKGRGGREEDSKGRDWD